MASLIHCIYASVATRPLAPTDLGQLLEVARANNQRRNLTGMLLYAEGSFFQVLEGAPEDVDAVFDRIAHDGRHENVTRIIREPIAARAFALWTMGFSGTTRAELDEASGTNDFFGEGQCLTQLDAGRAKKLLAGFRAGRWRRRLAGVGLGAA